MAEPESDAMRSVACVPVRSGTMSLGVLVAFFQYAQRFYEPISDLSEKYNILQAAMAASETAACASRTT